MNPLRRVFCCSKKISFILEIDVDRPFTKDYDSLIVLLRERPRPKQQGAAWKAANRGEGLG
jgi:hypothetical protein